MLLVTAANGNQGKLLIPKLIRAGVAIRASVETEGSAAVLRALGVDDVIVGSLADSDIMNRALDGVTQVYHVGPACHPDERNMGFAMIDAALRKDVRHFVLSSVLHAVASELVQHEIKRDIEEYLIKSGLEYTILQPTNYMLPQKIRPALINGVFRLSWSLDRLQSMVALDDVTDAVLQVVTNPGRHAAATYELAGEGRYSAYDIARVIAQVAQREIDVERVQPEDYLKVIFKDYDAETYPHHTSVHRSITEYYSAHDFVGNANVLTWLLGRPPTSFEQFVRGELAALEQVTGPAVQ